MNDNYYLIDSHCHLSDDAIYGNLDEKLNNAMLHNVKYLMSIGTNYNNSLKTIEIANKYNNVVCSIGTHPCEIEEYNPNVWDNITQNKNVVAIGEIGLDYYYVQDKQYQKKQIEVLQDMLSVAARHNLPCVFHVRDAFKDFYTIYDQSQAQRGVLHCFTGTIDEARHGLDLGLYISFSGIITFKNSDKLREVLKFVPTDRILLETDCPYLAPVPHRGQTNEPAFVKSTAIFMAECLGISLDKIANITSNNYFQLFKKAKDALCPHT